MHDLIKKLFIEYGFEAISIEDGTLFQNPIHSIKQEFWLVYSFNKPNDFLKKQAELFGKCQKHSERHELDKNISAIVLFETNHGANNETLKNEIMEVEEDASFFKKYVFIYSKKEMADFNSHRSETSYKDFIIKSISSQAVFSAYKRAYIEGWESLVYRLAIKLPFLNVDINDSKKLELLENQTRERILKAKDSNLVDVETVLFNSFKDKEESSIKEIPAEDFYNLLKGDKKWL